METVKVEKVTLFENGKEITEPFDSHFEDIDEVFETLLETDPSTFPENAQKITFRIYEFENDDYAQEVYFGKFKNEWYSSEYTFSLKGFYKNQLRFSVEGNEIDLANYLYEHIDQINRECHLDMNTEDFCSRIEPDVDVIEELIEELNAEEVEFELKDL